MEMTPEESRVWAQRRRQRLQAFMNARGLQVRPWTHKAGVHPNTLYHFLRGKTDSLRQDIIEKLAAAANVPAYELVGTGAVSLQAPAKRIEVIGAVEAGVWREALQWEPESRFIFDVPIDSRWSGVAFGLLVRGDSMNKKFPDGTIVVCVGLHDFDRPLVSGHFVIVQRATPNGLTEATVKELRIDARGRAWLWPRSDSPEHQQPIEIPWPYTDGAEAAAGVERVEVTAVVIGSYQPLL